MGLSCSVLGLLEQCLELIEVAEAAMGDHPGTDGWDGVSERLSDARGSLVLACEQLHRLVGQSLTARCVGLMFRGEA